MTFVDLRDLTGLVQVVFNPDNSPEAHQDAVPLRIEWVIQVQGVVRKRPAGMENKNLPTELTARDFIKSEPDFRTRIKATRAVYMPKPEPADRPPAASRGSRAHPSPPS